MGNSTAMLASRTVPAMQPYREGCLRRKLALTCLLLVHDGTIAIFPDPLLSTCTPRHEHCVSFLVHLG